MAFGYIGVEPTNNNTANNGVFSLKEINDLSDNAKLSSEAFDCDFVVVGGGGSAGTQAAGGAGGVCSSVDNQGGGGVLDDPLRLSIGVDYQVSIGAGASTSTRIGGATYFHTVSSLGGGRGYVVDSANDGASGGGGGTAFDYTNRGFSITKSMAAESERVGVFGSKSKQGGDGNYPSYESYSSGGGGGGASGGNGIVSSNGVNGIIVNIQSATNAGLSGAGEVSGINVLFGGGGGSGHANQGTSGGVGGGGNGFANSSNAGDPNTGGGGGGNWNGASSAGGSGVVVLSYPSTFTITAGAGVVISNEYDEGGGITSVAITSGSGTVSWSKA